MSNQNQERLEDESLGEAPVSVVGVSCTTRPATEGVKRFVVATDFLAAGWVSFVLCNQLGMIPFLTLKYAASWGGIFLCGVLLQLFLLPQSLGQWIWQVRRGQGSRGVFQFYQRDGHGLTDYWISAGKTLALGGVLFLTIGFCVFGHAVWRVGSPAQISPFAVDSSALVNWSSQRVEPKGERPSWFAAPFFYHLGLWPSQFDDEAVHYSLTYERGPPKRFVGKITAHLGKDRKTQLTIEGPKTPVSEQSQARLRECFTLRSPSLSCAFVRFRGIKRHLEEMQEQGAKSFHVQWFQVSQSQIPIEDQTQGIYLTSEFTRGRSRKRDAGGIQDRFILVNAAGLHQSLILDRADDAIGSKAFQLTQQIVGSLRSFRDLDAGRAWVNQELQKVQLAGLNSIQDAAALSLRLAEVQGLLISRVSVEPSHFETYFHLAGTSLLMGTLRGAVDGVPSQRQIALDNLSAAFRFARDVLPNEPRNDLMNGMLAELKNKK